MRLRDEAVHLIGDPVRWIEELLVLFIEPIVSQILDTYVTELVAYLAPTAVNNASHLVGHDELEVTSGKAVTDEETVLNLDGTNHVVIHHACLIVRHLGLRQH